MNKIDVTMNITIEKIDNLVTAKIPPAEIAKMLLTTDRPELTLYDVPPAMQIVFLECLARQAWYTKHKQHSKTLGV